MKGYKGFDKDLRCRDKNYEIGQTYEEQEVDFCNKGLHFCLNPHDIFRHYNAGENNRFAEIEAEEVSNDKVADDSKRVCKRLTINAEISVFKICKIAVSTFFENFKFQNKISEIPSDSPANAGNYGAAVTRSKGSASVGKGGVAIGMGKDSKVRGDIGALLVLTVWDDDGNITGYKTRLVDGEKIKANTFYILKGVRFVEEKNVN